MAQVGKLKKIPKKEEPIYDEVLKANLLRSARAGGWSGALKVDNTIPNVAQFDEGKEFPFITTSEPVKDRSHGMYDVEQKAMLKSQPRHGDVSINMDKAKDLNVIQRTGVLAHELGHGLGASHGSANSLMKRGEENILPKRTEAAGIQYDLRDWTRDIAGKAVDEEFKKAHAPKGVDKVFEFLTGLIGDIPPPSSAVDKDHPPGPSH